MGKGVVQDDEDDDGQQPNRSTTKLESKWDPDEVDKCVHEHWITLHRTRFLRRDAILLCPRDNKRCRHKNRGIPHKREKNHTDQTAVLSPLGKIERIVGIGRGNRKQRLSIVRLITFFGCEIYCPGDKIFFCVRNMNRNVHFSFQVPVTAAGSDFSDDLVSSCTCGILYQLTSDPPERRNGTPHPPAFLTGVSAIWEELLRKMC